LVKNPDTLPRLAALDAYRILDSAPEHGFDDLAQLAAHICATPIALVSLLDSHRQWFKAKVGLELAETPIEQAVCAYAIKQTDIFVIADLAQDERTSGNPLVTAPDGIRFYAGAPLITPEGVAIGTLCVIDKVPRPEGLGEAQRLMLAKLAGQVVTQLELRRLFIQETEAAAEKQAWQSVLTEELGHRLKNTLTTVQAIAAQTLKGTDAGLMKTFNQRLETLGLAHEILLKESWSEVRVEALVKAALGALANLERFEIAGCDLPFGPRAAVTLSLIVHELATNAIKYGALSQPGGTVSVAWKIEAQSDGAGFVFNWVEHGGPPVLKPTQRGFGSRLIQMGLAGAGGAELFYEPDGFKARLSAPLHQLQGL